MLTPIPSTPPYGTVRSPLPTVARPRDSLSLPTTPASTRMRALQASTPPPLSPSRPSTEKLMDISFDDQRIPLNRSRRGSSASIASLASGKPYLDPELATLVDVPVPLEFSAAQLRRRRLAALASPILFEGSLSEDGATINMEHDQALPEFSQRYSGTSESFLLLDGDDPRVTGVPTFQGIDEKWRDKYWKEAEHFPPHKREKVVHALEMQFAVEYTLIRHRFIETLGQALMSFGSPAHRLKGILDSTAHALDVDVAFNIRSDEIELIFRGNNAQTTYTTLVHAMHCSHLCLSRLNTIHSVYRRLVRTRELTPLDATELLRREMHAPPLLGFWLQLFLSFLLSFLLSNLAFGGAFVDMIAAGVGAMIVFLSTYVVRGSIAKLTAEFVSVSIVSFAAAIINILTKNLVCWHAVAYSSIIGRLQGYSAVLAVLELVLGQTDSGAVKLVRALMSTLVLSFGLEVGTDIVFTIFPQSSLKAEAASIPHVIEGCYRPPGTPWFYSRFPWYFMFFTVPLFAVARSIANKHPWRKWRDLLVAIFITICAYTVNKAANRFLVGQTAVLPSLIGAFTVGFIGNLYSRIFHASAFTAMVSGVMMLVPSGLGDLHASMTFDDSLKVTGEMLKTVIGILLGLSAGHCAVHFGKRDRAAMFSF
ncbi:unnamed protein product [Peniophora sp. CBMAI 1063]|nr:unnamed protein product [Peniophora sp. CBMAI 1063]